MLGSNPMHILYLSGSRMYICSNVCNVQKVAGLSRVQVPSRTRGHFFLSRTFSEHLSLINVTSHQVSYPGQHGTYEHAGRKYNWIKNLNPPMETLHDHVTAAMLKCKIMNSVSPGTCMYSYVKAYYCSCLSTQPLSRGKSCKVSIIQMFKNVTLYKHSYYELHQVS